jgi:acyl-CoA reductase-like NAD-dependent aldehyde dehydrogenase
VTNVTVQGILTLFVYHLALAHSLSDSLLSDELFGPILPVIKASYTEAYKVISAMEHPLALSIFSTQNSVIDESASSILLIYTDN